ncbi:MAG: LysE family translocator [Bacteroidota bacterium]|nr:LysE family translocator [Bacteroidota bacterium]
MLPIIFKGVGLGFALALLIGPVFFLLIQTSIKRGFLPAFYTAIGVSLSDAMYVTITYLGLAQYSDNEWVIKIMGIGGGALLIAFGAYSIFKKTAHAENSEIEFSKKDRLKYFLKGFTLNFINPGVFFFWIGAVGVASLDLEYYNNKVALFFSCTVLTVFLTDLLKIYLAQRLSDLLHDNVLKWLNRISGIALIVFGLKLLLEKL